MQSFFFPCLGITPDFDQAMLDLGVFAVHRRVRRATTFDLATLETRHKLHIPYQLMDVYLWGCELELELKGAAEFEQASDEIQIIRALFYVYGVRPFVLPFATTYSVNQYAGINSRDSELLREKMPEDMREGLTSEKGTVEAWPLDMTLHLIQTGGTKDISPTVCSAVASRFYDWKNLEKGFPALNLVRRLLTSAPMIPDLGSSILHIWQGVESLFPTVTSEVSFRLALLVSQLCAPLRNPGATHKETKSQYIIRSKIAHGSSAKVVPNEWVGAWSALCLCLRSVIERKRLPSEQDLLAELLPD